MSPALKGSSAIRRFECGDAIKIRNGIAFDFYTGLAHIHTYMYIHTYINNTYTYIHTLVHTNAN